MDRVKVIRTTFYEINKISHICSIFRKSVCIRVVHIFWDRTSFVFLLFSRKGGRNSESSWMTFMRYFLKTVCIFIAYWRTAEKILLFKVPVKRTEHFTEQHWTFVECKMFRAFDHLVEPCSPLLSLVQWSLIAIKLFTEQMLSDSTSPLFFEMLSVVQCVWPVTEHLFSSPVRSRWMLARSSVLFSQNVQSVWPGRYLLNILLNNTEHFTERFTEQHWTFVECKMFRAFDHLVEPCSSLLSLVQWSLIAIKLFTEEMLSNSTFPLFFEMLSVVQCVWPVTKHLFSSRVQSGWLVARSSALFSKMFSKFDHSATEHH